MIAQRPARSQPIEARIQARYSELPPSERVLADLILSFPGELASYSASELTKLAKVSNATATRLFQRLGYASYDEARQDARGAQRWGSPRYLNSPALEGRALAEATQSHIACEVANLQATFAALPVDLESIVAALAEAPRVFCLGFRKSHMLASYMRWTLIQVRRNVCLLPAAGETLSEYISEIDRGDVLVAIGLRRRTPGFRLAAKAAHVSGAKVLLITDTTAGPLTDLGTWNIACEGRSTSAFDSDISAMSIIHFLGFCVTDRLGAAGRDRMRAIEALHDEFEEFE